MQAKGAATFNSSVQQISGRPHGESGAGFSVPAGGAKFGAGYGAQASVGINETSTLATGTLFQVPDFLKNLCPCEKK
jgi:hypothetical protein